MTFGKRGWYWQMKTRRYGVVITDYRLLNRKFNRHQDYKYPPGAEDIFYMSESEFRINRISRLLLVDPARQDELRELHEAKGRMAPANTQNHS